MRKVLQPLSFLDLRTSPKMWSPTYNTSLKRQKVSNAKKGCTNLQNKDATPALGPNKLGENLRTASTVHSRVLQGPSVRPNAQPSRFFVHLKKKYLNRLWLSQVFTLCQFYWLQSPLSTVHLPQHCALSKKAWFPGINEGEVEVWLPGASSIRGIREIQQEIHDLLHHYVTTTISIIW